VSAPEYRFGTRSRECMITGRPFAPGETIVTVIETDPLLGFVRRDVCEEAFAGADGAFSHWRSRQPENREDEQKLDFDLAREFLEKLIIEADPEREALTYVLTLLLARKRRVKIQATRSLPEGDLLTVVLRGQEEDREVQVRAPHLDEERIGALQAELARLFGFAQPEEPAPDAPDITEEPA